MSGTERIFLEASARQRLPGSRLLKAPDPGEVIRATVLLRPASSGQTRQRVIGNLASRLPHNRRRLPAVEFERLHGARPGDMTRVTHFARNHRLRVVESDRAKRSIVLEGTVSDFSKAFAVEFAAHRFQQRSYRSFRGSVSIPASLADAVVAVLGLDTRPLMEHHAFLQMHATAAGRAVDPKSAARKYGFPLTAAGEGQCIAIVMLGGGFHENDIDDYFRGIGLRKPDIAVVELAGARNNPSPPDKIKAVLDLMGAEPVPLNSAAGDDKEELRRALWTIEATLDIELIGTFANKARLVVYFAPDHDQEEYLALSEALHSVKHPPSIISCSWGGAEQSVPHDFAVSLDRLFQDAALKGVTVCFSSGDRGADPDPKTGRPQVHFPASSPHVLACGGTHWLNDFGPLEEHVWNETLPKTTASSGGGASSIFPLPAWQVEAGVQKKTGGSGRGVPDVAGKADIESGYRMRVGGYTVGMGGTSAAAPLWAGLLARFNERLGRNAGYITPLLYQRRFRRGLREITRGSNGTFQACPGWNPCTGLGTPRGTKLLAVLKGSSAKK